jgi:hypothetical protein
MTLDLCVPSATWALSEIVWDAQQERMDTGVLARPSPVVEVIDRVAGANVEYQNAEPRIFHPAKG